MKLKPIAAANLAIIFLIISCSFSPCGEKPKTPSFAKAKITEAESLIRSVFQEEYSSAKKQSEVGEKLAATLLAQSKEIKEFDHVRFVALREARDLAARAGNSELAFSAIEEMAKYHKVDALNLRADVLTVALDSVQAKAKAKSLADVAYELSEDCSLKEIHSLALKLGRLAEKGYRLAEEKELLKTAALRNKKLVSIYEEDIRVRPFEEKLKENPNDPTANFELGKYWCFVRAHWLKGLPYLSRSGDPVFGPLAKADLNNPSEPKKMLKVAEDWNQAAKAKKGEVRALLQRRSYQWYQRAASRSEGASKGIALVRIKELKNILPPSYLAADIQQEIRKITGHKGEVLCVTFSPDGRTALSCSADETVKLWDLLSGRELRTFKGHLGAVFSVAISADGNFAVSGSEDRTARVWNLISGKEKLVLKDSKDFVNGVAISPDNKLIAGAGQDHTVYLWKASTGKLLKTLKGHTGAVFGITFSPLGSRLATGSTDNTIRIWNVDSGKEEAVLKGHTAQVLGLSYSPDGNYLLSSGEDRTVRLWDLAAKKEIRQFLGHRGMVGSVAFSPEGLRFLSASDDMTIRLWDLNSGKQLREITGHKDAIYRVENSPAGLWAISSRLEGTIRLWGEQN